MYQDVFKNHIIYILKKSDKIVLKDAPFILATILTLLLGGKNNSLAVLLNDYNLAIYRSKTSDMTILTGTWKFIAPNRLLKWSIYHVHQDVVIIVFCIL